jgi:hypothetical protein
MALPTLSGLTKSIYGTNASNAVNHGMAGVLSTDLMRESKLVDIANKAIAERTRRGGSAIQLPASYFSGQILGSRVQDIISTVAVAGQASSQAYNGTGQNVSSGNGQVVTGYTPELDSYGNPTGGQTPVYGPTPTPETITYPQSPAPSVGTSFSRGQQTSAADINVLIGAINSAGQVCTCNCNYCTCNCNYCTCNCNYSCTCNCNYGSDIRLKENIKFIKVENNLNIYSWNYIKDKSTRYRGVMAQELEGTEYECALGKDLDGYYFVNYSKLPINFEVE